MKNKKILFLSTIFLLSILLIPQISLAGTLQIGDICNTNADCITGDCESSDFETSNNSFCVCSDTSGVTNISGESQQCADKYGKQAGEKWVCMDGSAASHDLHYCGSSISGLHFPLTSDQSSNLKIAENTVEAPFLPAIGDICQLSDANVAGGQSSQVNWIAQCLSGLYRYAVVFGTTLAVLFLMIGGIMYLLAGGKSDYVTTGKSFITGSILGIVLLLGSYLMLFLINPKLVDIPVMTFEAVQMEDLDIIEGLEEHYEVTQGNQATSPYAKSISTKSTDCKTAPSQSSNIGNTKYLGLLDCHSTKERELTDIVNIVLHDTGATTSKTVNYWIKKCNEGSLCVASHYSIERDGSIYQLLDEKKVGIHAGAFNKSSIGIDLVSNISTKYHYFNMKDCLLRCKNEQYSNCNNKQAAITRCTPTVTQAQYNALNILINDIASRTGVTKTDSGIHSHCEIAHGDPRNFDWTKIGLTAKPHKDATSYSTNACFFYNDYYEKVAKEAEKIFK